MVSGFRAMRGRARCEMPFESDGRRRRSRDAGGLSLSCVSRRTAADAPTAHAWGRSAAAALGARLSAPGRELTPVPLIFIARHALMMNAQL